MSELRKDYATNTWVEALSDSDGSSLADLLRESLRRLHQVVDDPDFNYYIHTAPTGTKEADFHWHVEITPRLAELAGFEQGTGMFINQVMPEDAGEKVRFPGDELAAVFHGPSRPFDFLDGGIDVVWVLEAEPEMRHARHPADGFPVPLEDDHVARPGRLPLDRPRFSVDLAKAEDSLVESERALRVSHRQTDVRQPVRLDHGLADGSTAGRYLSPASGVLVPSAGSKMTRATRAP